MVPAYQKQRKRRKLWKRNAHGFVNSRKNHIHLNAVHATEMNKNNSKKKTGTRGEYHGMSCGENQRTKHLHFLSYPNIRIIPNISLCLKLHIVWNCLSCFWVNCSYNAASYSSFEFIQCKPITEMFSLSSMCLYPFVLILLHPEW